MPKYRAHQLHPPAREFDLEVLEDTIRVTVETVSAPVPDELGGGRITWGPELDIQRIVNGGIIVVAVLIQQFRVTSFWRRPRTT